ncbi:hypothetical protein F4825DRAFT_431860 [Nemania diffusa]|nr:hypothetical protein F4825DRAFT_431860 [Nemania diffusa]
MNRLCQSSYGSLEAVISLSNFGGGDWRRLMHFTRDRMTGQWSAQAVICDHPITGGSIVQNIAKLHDDQEHGDFEVVVLEETGLKHYTRGNYVTAPLEVKAWECTATILADDGSYPPAVAAAPLLQTRIPMNGNIFETTLETVVLGTDMTHVHYRCPQRTSSNLKQKWHRGETIGGLGNGTGPATLYQTSPNMLLAFVPTKNGIEEYSFVADAWKFIAVVSTMQGPTCVYSGPFSTPATLRALVYQNFRIGEFEEDPGSRT